MGRRLEDWQLRIPPTGSFGYPRPNPTQHNTTHPPQSHHYQEEYLSDAEFEQVFGIDKEEFKSMPAWKRINAKKSKGLF